MPTSIFDPRFAEVIEAARERARSGSTTTVDVSGVDVGVPDPFPSPVDWRECWIYFLMIDRFNNPAMAPRGTWNQRYDFRQGGTLAGVTAQLDYLRDLGARAVWLSPVLKNARPDWRYNYHGYGAQDFLAVDERFGSDGTTATAERELKELVEQAHGRGLYVILDIVLNHAGRVFDYVRDGRNVDRFADPAVMDAPLGTEPPIRWLNGFGFPRADWQDTIPGGSTLSPDDAVQPDELRRHVFYRRRGTKLTDEAPPGGFVRGDFEDMRQLVFEFDATSPGQQPIRAQYGSSPVLNILVQVYSYLIARYDLDAFRVDTAKYVSAIHLERFGNAIREFAQTVGKRNFFTFGEIFDDEETIARFVGRNSTDTDSFGIDAALDFPLFYQLPGIAKARVGVEQLRATFEARKTFERDLLSTHGEAGKYFVTFLDNHDMKERFNHPLTPPEQVTLGLACLFTLQGIPCLYYGTEQGLQGTVSAGGSPELNSNESSREALWGKPNPFDRSSTLFQQVQTLAHLRRGDDALRFGRLYFRELSGNGRDFGHSHGPGGVVAFSRIVADREVVTVANCHPQQRFTGHVLQDLDLNQRPRQMSIAYSNRGRTGSPNVQVIAAARFFTADRQRGEGPAAALPLDLMPMEVQILVPG